MKKEEKEQLKEMADIFSNLVEGLDVDEEAEEDDLEGCVELLLTDAMFSMTSPMAMIYNLLNMPKEDVARIVTKNGALTMKEARDSITFRMALEMQFRQHQEE